MEKGKTGEEGGRGGGQRAACLCPGSVPVHQLGALRDCVTVGFHRRACVCALIYTGKHTMNCKDKHNPSSSNISNNMNNN